MIAPNLSDLRARRDEILALVEAYGVSNIRIVGSVARHEATDKSDIDLLLSIPPDQDVFDLVGLWLDFEALLGCKVNLIPDNSSNKKFLQAVMADAVPL